MHKIDLGSSCGHCHVPRSLVVPASTGWSCRGSGLCQGDGPSAPPYQGILQSLVSGTVCCDRHGLGKMQDWGLNVGSHVLYKISRNFRIIVPFCLVTILASKMKKKKRKKITSPINHPSIWRSLPEILGRDYVLCIQVGGKT